MVVKHVKMPRVGTETECRVIAAQKSKQKKKQKCKTNLIKLLINISVLRTWSRKGEIMALNLCPVRLNIFLRETKTKSAG